MKLVKQHSKDKYYFFLAAQLLFIFILPLMPADNNLAGIFISISLSVILVLGANLINAGKYSKRFSLALAAVFVILNSILQVNQFHGLMVLTFTLFFCLFLMILYQIIKMLITTKEVKASLIAGAIAGYLLMGISMAFFFSLLAALSPGFISLPMAEITFQKLMYFSFINMTTIGYGDIIPVSAIAQTVSMMAGVFSQFYMAVVVAVIVGKLMNSSTNK